MHFSIQNKQVAELDGFEFLPGDPVAGAHELRLRIRIMKRGSKEFDGSWNAGDPAWTLQFTGARVGFVFGAAQLGLGNFEPMPQQRLVAASPDSQRAQVEFSLDVSPRAIDLIEQHRAGGDLLAYVRVTAIASLLRVAPERGSSPEPDRDGAS